MIAFGVVGELLVLVLMARRPLPGVGQLLWSRSRVIFALVIDRGTSECAGFWVLTCLGENRDHRSGLQRQWQRTDIRAT